MNLIDLIFPKNCLNCKKSGGYLCLECISKVKKVSQICPICGKSSIDGFSHVKCRKMLGVDGLTSIWEYSGVIRKAIIKLKYNYADEIVTELVSYLVRVLRDKEVLVPSTYTLVPIPMHWFRENSRGFNQSVDIGRLVAIKMRWKFVPNLLKRVKLNTPQAKLSGSKRKKNIQGVFVANNGLLNQLNNVSVVLFDDVYTTGSTLKEATKVLKRSGVKSVWGLTIVRAT